jgi:hypothetical protein
MFIFKRILQHRRGNRVGGFNMSDTFVSTYYFDRHDFFRFILAIRIFWGFDGTLQDLYNNFNGVGINGPSFRSPGYNGAGSCLYLNQSSRQSVTITTPPFLNMAFTSFTLELWMYANTLRTTGSSLDNAIFGQFQQNILDKSLHIIVRNQRIYLGFYGDDAVGTQVSEK